MALKTEKVFNSFVKGLITEASPLTFPENASVDEENFVLNRDGSRARRLGLDYEDLYAKTELGYTVDQLSTTRQSFHKWESPGGDTSISIGVVRVGSRLWFMDMLTTNPSGNLLNGGNSITVTGLQDSRIETTVISNKLIIVSEDLVNPVLLEYNPDNGIISQETYNIKIRDIFGVHDGIEVYERPPYSAPPSTLTRWEANKEVNLRTGDQFYVPSTDRVYQITDFYFSTRTVQTGYGIYFTYSTQNYTKFGASAPTSTSGVEFNGNYTVKFVRSGTGSGISPTHKYNLRNQGWATGIQVVGGGDAIDETGKDIGVYPSNADQWTLGKNSNPNDGDKYEKYDPTILRKNSTSRYQAPKGSMIIDAFNRGASRQTESGISSGLSSDKETGSISTITSYAQRLFYSGVTSNVQNGDERSPNYSGYVFFTRTIQSNRDLGRCYQEADPADPSINDLVDSDGGTIQIPDATRIIKIVASQASILVFAENGVWEIYGDTGGFIATSFQISKVSTNGVLNADSIVSVNGNFIYWSKAGIYRLAPDGTGGRFSATSLSLTTIQSLYLNIPDLGKNNCKGFYDEKENRVRYLYNDTVDYATDNYINKYNKELIMDLTLESFYVNSFSDLDTSSPFVCDYVEIPGYSVSTTDAQVESGTDGVVQVGADDVIVTQDTLVNRSSLFSYLTICGTYFTLSKYNSTTFKDWFTEDGVGANYVSYLVTGYEMMNDVMRQKQVPYIFFYFKKTEDGFDISGDDLTLSNPSSCKVQAQWNWANHANSGKWGREFQAYRILRFYTPASENDNFDNGDDVIVTKNKLRGSGKTLSLKITSEEGKDMKLLGWAFPATAIQTV